MSTVQAIATVASLFAIGFVLARLHTVWLRRVRRELDALYTRLAERPPPQPMTEAVIAEGAKRLLAGHREFAVAMSVLLSMVEETKRMRNYFSARSIAFPTDLNEQCERFSVMTPAGVIAMRVAADGWFPVDGPSTPLADAPKGGVYR